MILPVSHEQVRDYLGEYAVHYRAMYQQLVASPPDGAGYPQLAVSPFLGAGTLECYVATNGSIIVQWNQPEPGPQWWIVGGPALMVDTNETKTPPAVTEALRAAGLLGKPIGIYRIVAKDPISEEVWAGRLDPQWPRAEAKVDKLTITAIQTNLALDAVLQRLTFGAFGLVLDIHLGGADGAFWLPHVVRDLGFVTADRVNRRFANYMEIGTHVDHAAWDRRNLPVRLSSDIRRDFAYQFARPGPGGTLAFGRLDWAQPFADRLSRLKAAIDAFDALLRTMSDADEAVFQTFLHNNPILLDVYGEVVAKPQFPYPPGATPLGKAFVVPDFVIRYPERRYRLVEIERPGKTIATEAGHPRVDLTQAAFQIAEWRAHIANHYDLIRDRFPGINLSNTAMVVLSRGNATAYGRNHDPGQYQELLRAQYPNIEIVTYQDLATRAREAYARLASLGFPS